MCMSSHSNDMISQAYTINLIDVWLQHALLSSTDGFGVKVALSIYRNGFLHSGTDWGVYVVRWQSSSYGTEARHGHLEKLCVIFLHGEEKKDSEQMQNIALKI